MIPSSSCYGFIYFDRCLTLSSTLGRCRMKRERTTIAYFLRLRWFLYLYSTVFWRHFPLAFIESLSFWNVIRAWIRVSDKKRKSGSYIHISYYYSHLTYLNFSSVIIIGKICANWLIPSLTWQFKLKNGPKPVWGKARVPSRRWFADWNANATLLQRIKLKGHSPWHFQTTRHAIQPRDRITPAVRRTEYRMGMRMTEYYGVVRRRWCCLQIDHG